MTASRITQSDYRETLKIVSEAADRSVTESPDAIVEAVMSRACEVLGAGAGWLAVMRADTGADAGVNGDRRWQVVGSLVHGLDADRFARWETWFLKSGRYEAHPLMAPFHRTAGRPRAYLRREVVEDATWYRSPHVAEFARSLGFDDVVGAAVPLGPGVEAYLAMCRPWGDRSFDKRERVLIDHLHRPLGWLWRSWHATEPHPADRLAADLSPRLADTLACLLEGLSEKQIAGVMGLSPRSVHKYVERVYRVFDVSSRGELMAMWIRPPAGHNGHERG